MNLNPRFAGRQGLDRNMSETALRLVSQLFTVSTADATLVVAPPSSSAEAAAKGLRKVCDITNNANEAQKQMRDDVVRALFQEETAGAGVVPARLLLEAVIVATDAIDAIDRTPTADTAECGLLRWGHLRVNVLQVLLHMASSESNSSYLLGIGRADEGKWGSVVSACVHVLQSNSARTDFEGVRTCANLLRNLCMPKAHRARVGALEGIFTALMKHLSHKDANVSVIAAATLRILVHECPENGRLAAYSCLGMSAERGIGGRGSQGESSSASSAESGTAGHRDDTGCDAARHADGCVFEPILGLDLSTIHPHGREELARFVCLTIAATLREDEPKPPPTLPQREGMGACASDKRSACEGLHIRMCSAHALQFGVFLLAAPHPALRSEALNALVCARRLYKRLDNAPEEGDGRVDTNALVWPGPQLRVISPAGDRPLVAALDDLVAQGAIPQDLREMLI